MTVPTFASQRTAWANPPVDDVGYISSAALLRRSDDELRAMVASFEQARYQGWRNWQGRWRSIFRMDETQGMRVLDYGCGVGIEALQYARADNQVFLADIVASNVRLAERVLEVCGEKAAGCYVIKNQPPFIVATAGSLDIIHCVGVLHHIPQPLPIVKRFHQLLAKGGELRLMVYSDIAWLLACDTEPPAVVEGHPQALRYASIWDGVGGYADWYDKERLMERFGKWFDVTVCEPLTEKGEYLGAVLVKR